MKKLGIITFALALCLTIPVNQVLAHATPITYQPEASSTLESLPEEVTIHFSERVEPHASGISVLGPNGESIHMGKAKIDPNDSRLYSIKLKDAETKGTYTVSWHVVSSDDGHFTKGAYVFSIGEESAVIMPTESQFQIVHSSALQEALTIWAELLGQSILLGFLILYTFLWKPLRKKANINISSVERRLSIAVITAVSLILIGTASYLIIKTGEIQQLQSLGFAEAFQTLLTTATGSFTLYRLIGALLFGALFFTLRRRSQVILWAITLAIIYMRAQVSHAAASHFLPDLSVFMNFIHLTGKGLWVGGLIVFAYVLLPGILKESEKFIHFSSITFSRIISIAFGVASISGIYIIWLHLKDPANSLTTEWGVRFMVLTLLALVFIALRLFNQLIIDRDKTKSSWLPFTISTEAIVGVALLFVTSFLIITTPPLTYKNSFIKTADSQGMKISLMEHPLETNNLTVLFKDKNGETTFINEAIVTLRNEQNNIGPIVAGIERRTERSFIFPKSILSPAGTWQINITGQRQGSYDAVTSFQVDFPREVDVGRPDPNARAFGYFEILSIIGIIGVIGFTRFLYQYSNRLYASTQEEGVPINKKYIKHPYYSSLIAGTAILLLVWVSYAYILKGDFQKICENNGHFWNQTVPQRFGKATSQVAVTGCSLGVGAGQFHFADKEEYLYFLRLAEANVELTTNPEQLKAGESTNLTFLIKDFEGSPARELVHEHERILHTIIISEDFESFAHIHAEDQGLTRADIEAGRFPLKYTFPKGGRYLISVDFVIRAHHFSEQFVVDVSGEPTMKEAPPNLSREKEFDGYKVALKAPASAKTRESIKLQYLIEKDGEPVFNLEPYLGAPMHLAVVRSDLRRFTHTHGEIPPGFIQQLIQDLGKGKGQHIHNALPDAFGPAIDAYLSFPHPGLYQIFGEFKHKGKVTKTRFEIEVK